MQQAAALAQQALQTALVAAQEQNQSVLQEALQAQHAAEEQQLQAIADCEALAYYADKSCPKQCLISPDLFIPALSMCTMTQGKVMYSAAA